MRNGKQSQDSRMHWRRNIERLQGDCLRQLSLESRFQQRRSKPIYTIFTVILTFVIIRYSCDKKIALVRQPGDFGLMECALIYRVQRSRSAGRISVSARAKI